jgi:hypothetical protein
VTLDGLVDVRGCSHSDVVALPRWAVQLPSKYLDEVFLDENDR